jgi:hypothetical protein
MTYRTLQRQFQLDDDALHDLKDELLYAHPGFGRDTCNFRSQWSSSSKVSFLGHGADAKFSL